MKTRRLETQYNTQLTTTSIISLMAETTNMNTKGIISENISAGGDTSGHSYHTTMAITIT
jgi:uncharacterized protein YgbK (DUF1537 family)